jgi:hypothetical protein
MVAPQTEIRTLMHIPFNTNYSHVRDFPNVEAQTNYFLSRAYHIFFDFNYIREENAIKVFVPYDDVVNVNYIMYRNGNYTDKWFYAFITKKEYVNPNTTRIFFEMDVYQTWMFEMYWRPSFTVREHVSLWSGGKPTMHTIDEGLDYGTDYETVSITKYQPFSNVYFMVIICKETMHSNLTDGVKPVLNGLPQPLTYYIHPFKLDGTTPNIMLDGEGALLSSIKDVFEAIFKNEKAVNNVVNIYVTEYCGIDMTYDAQYDEWNMNRNNVQNVAINGTPSFTTLNVWQMPNYTKKELTLLSNVFDGFEPVTESKLLNYPYALTILDDFKGNRIELKHEYLDTGILNLMIQGSLGTSNKVSYTVTNYLRDGDLDPALLHVHGMETSVVNNNPNDLPILSEYLSAFLQGNRNTLENQANATVFNGIMGVLGAGIRNPVGAIESGVNTLFQIQGMNAKIKDISNIPPTLTKLGGNTYFDYGNNINGLYVIKKQITQEHRDKLTDYFKMYGYKVNRLKVPNLNTRPAFNFVQTVDAHITGNIPHNHLETLCSIFNNGVTIWHGDYVGDYGQDNGS